MPKLPEKLRRLEESPATAIAALIASAALCASQLSARSTWGDEICSLFAVTLPGLAETWKYLVNDVHPPLYFLLLKAWVAVFGDSLEAARAFSIVAVVGGVGLVGLTGRRFFSARAGLWAVLFSGFTPFLIYHSVHARMYGLLFFVAALVVFAGLWVREYPRPARLALLVAAGVALLYTQYIGVFLLAGVFVGAGLLSLDSRRKFVFWLAAGVVTALVFAPWVPIFIRQTSTATITEGSARFTFGLNHLKFFAKIASPLDHASPAWLGVIGAVVAGALVIAGAGVAATGERRDAGRWLVAVTVAGIGLFIAAALVKPLVVTRTMIWFLPAFGVFAGIALARLPGAARAAIGVLLLIGVIFSLPDLDGYRRHTDWRGTVTWLSENFLDGDVVALDRSVTFCETVALDYYLDRSPLKDRLLKGRNLLRLEAGAPVSTLPPDPRRRWFFLEPSERPSPGLHQSLQDLGFVMQDRVTFFELGLTLYDPPERTLHRPGRSAEAGP